MHAPDGGSRISACSLFSAQHRCPLFGCASPPSAFLRPLLSAFLCLYKKEGLLGGISESSVKSLSTEESLWLFQMSGMNTHVSWTPNGKSRFSSNPPCRVCPFSVWCWVASLRICRQCPLWSAQWKEGSLSAFHTDSREQNPFGIFTRDSDVAAQLYVSVDLLKRARGKAWEKKEYLAHLFPNRCVGEGREEYNL